MQYGRYKKAKTPTLLNNRGGDSLYQVIKIKGYSCPNKWLLLVDGKPICFANSRGKLSSCISYLEGYPVEISDGAIKKLLDGLRGARTWTKLACTTLPKSI
jgi:hypothetical protein